MKVKRMRWIILIAMIAAVFCAAYLLCKSPFARTSLHLHMDNIERIDFIYAGPDGAPAAKTLEIPPWVDFFNSLQLTYHKDGWIMYNRPGTQFEIYYVDGTMDTIGFHFGHLIYNDDFYDIDNHEGKTIIHDQLLY